MSAASDPGWLFAENLTGIPTQLEYGIRALLVKSHYGTPTGVDIGGAELVVTDTAAEADNDQQDEVAELSAAAVARAQQLEAPSRRPRHRARSTSATSTARSARRSSPTPSSTSAASSTATPARW